MMVKLSTEYYNLEKVAEVLSVSTAEVNRLREQSKLRGFRDGTDWKFLKEEVHNYLAATIKARSGNASNGQKPGDSDFDILGNEGASSSFDLLVENAAPLPDDNQLVSVSPQTHPASDLDLAALDNDELALAEETRISSVTMPQKGKNTEVEEDSSDVALAEETRISSITVPKKGKKAKIEEDSSAVLELAPDSVLLDDNESVLGAGGSSPQLGLAGDSGFDMLVAGEGDSDLLEVAEEKTSVVLTPEEFSLEPSASAKGGDDSESSSQVIAIDAGFAGMGQDAPFGQDDFSMSEFGFDSGIQAPSSGTAANDPFGTGTTAFPDALSASAPSVSPRKVMAPAEEYSSGMLLALVFVLFVMLVPGYMLVDTMVHMWSWNDPFILNSFLMDTISNLFGL